MVNKLALAEGIKAFLRFIWFGLIGLIITYLQSKFVHDPNLIVALVATGIVNALDRYVHKNPDIAINGLAPPPLQS